MRIFICAFGEEVDLDNPDTYINLPDNTKELRSLMFQEIGYYYCYVNFWHKDVYKVHKDQKKRVEKLIKNFTENERSNRNNVIWYKEQVFIFQDEIENMC